MPAMNCPGAVCRLPCPCAKGSRKPAGSRRSDVSGTSLPNLRQNVSFPGGTGQIRKLPGVWKESPALALARQTSRESRGLQHPQSTLGKSCTCHNSPACFHRHLARRQQGPSAVTGVWSTIPVPGLTDRSTCRPCLPRSCGHFGTDRSFRLLQARFSPCAPRRRGMHLQQLHYRGRIFSAGMV